MGSRPRVLESDRHSRYAASSVEGSTRPCRCTRTSELVRNLLAMLLSSELMQANSATMGCAG